MHNVNKNTKYFGRFLVPLYLNASFVAILDDNCIPSHNWLRHSIQLCQVMLLLRIEFVITETPSRFHNRLPTEKLVFGCFTLHVVFVVCSFET